MPAVPNSDAPSSSSMPHDALRPKFLLVGTPRSSVDAHLKWSKHRSRFVAICSVNTPPQPRNTSSAMSVADCANSGHPVVECPDIDESPRLGLVNTTSQRNPIAAHRWVPVIYGTPQPLAVPFSNPVRSSPG
ncbi:hypothetical protein DHEL01_v201745 [Diaporthe helianthi]|uniref:Uncharacterized protein n=1 Tax=Diaporthe helianthi TaxID=158607 RepID=A0A2P5IBI2_DIAHE|nr:hypothetical protein DHEL01_v201745 [Diaporthe helianthi]